MTPSEQYGIQLVEAGAPSAPPSELDGDRASAPPDAPPRIFHWVLLAGVAAVEVGYLSLLGSFVHWLVVRVSGA